MKLTLAFGAALFAAFVVVRIFPSLDHDNPPADSQLVISPVLIAPGNLTLEAPASPESFLAELTASGTEGGTEAFRDWVYRMPVAEIHRLIWHCLAPGNFQLMGTTAIHLLEAMAEWDPFAAIELAWRIPDEELGKKARNAIMAEWGMHDPKSAIAYVATLPENPLRQGLGPAIVEAWASYAAEEAFYYLAGLPLADGGRLIKSAAAALSVHDLETFHTFLSVIQNPDLIGRTIEGLTDAMPTLTSEELILLAGSFSENVSVRMALLTVAGRRFAGERLHEGWALLGSFESHSMNDQFAFGLGREQLKIDLMVMLEAAMENYEDYWHRRLYHFMIVDGVPDHLDLIYDFAESLPDVNRDSRNPRCQAWISLAEGLARVSHETAIAWIEQLDDGPDKAAAVLGMAREVMLTDIPTASAWVVNVPGEQRLRTTAARNLLLHWKRSDEPAARNWAVMHGFEFPE